MKFHRTYHLPWSPGQTSDDKTHTRKHIEQTFLGRILTITEKLDGENQDSLRTGWHLRSESATAGGVLRSRSKAHWAKVKAQLEWDTHYFVEDISNVHSIEYSCREHLFFLLAVLHKDFKYWDTWEALVKAAALAQIPPVPLLAQRVFNSVAELKAVTTQLAQQPSVLGGVREGVVVRLDEPLDAWTPHTAKWVRAGHVQTGHRWTQGQLRTTKAP